MTYKGLISYLCTGLISRNKKEKSNLIDTGQRSFSIVIEFFNH